MRGIYNILETKEKSHNDSDSFLGALDALCFEHLLNQLDNLATVPESME